MSAAASGVRARKPVSSAPASTAANGSSGAEKWKRDTFFPADTRESMGLGHWLIIVVFIGLLFAVCSHFDEWLPPPAGLDAEGFSEARARRFLTELVKEGPRPSGSYANEVHAKALILRELQAIKAGVHQSQRLEIETQFPSGCFSLSLLSFFNLCYRNVTNIVARLGPAKGPAEHSLLLSCHFDSVPTSPGASDDGVSCATMLEMLGLMARSATPNRHDVIFLFNGAEENFLQAAHGFITQHPWRHSVRAFVNLESCGGGGREFLFQSGPGNPWLLQAYLENAPFPHTTVLGQDVFESGYVTSTTDFQVFRDYGRVPGLDIAYIRNGYVYHTEFDVPGQIPAGSIQRAGENVLPTVLNLANSPYVAKPASFEGEVVVFFDFLGLFVVRYPLWLARYLNLLVVVAVFAKIAWNILASSGRHGSYSAGLFASACMSHLLATVAILAVMEACAFGASVVGLSLFWFSRPWLVVPLYLCPGLSTLFYFHTAVRDWWYRKRKQCGSVDGWMTERAHYDAALAVLAVMLAYLGVYRGFASAYLLFAYTLFALLRDGIKLLLRTVSGCSERNMTVHLVAQLVALTIPATMGSYAIRSMLLFFVPIFGRSGSTLNPELAIAFLVGLVAITLSLFFSSLVLVSHGTKSLARWLAFFSIVAYAVVALSPLGYPYRFSEEAPTLRRVYLQHTSRQVIDRMGNEKRDNGIWVVPLDYRGASDLPPALISSAKPASEACLVNDTYCALPYYLPGRHMIFKSSLWMETLLGPQFKTPLKLKVVERTHLPDGAINVSLSISGPDHITAFFTPKPPFRMRSWSVRSDGATPYPQPSYFLFLADGAKQTRPWLIHFVLENPSDAVHDDETIGTVTAASHIIHGEEMHSESLKSIVSTTQERRARTHLAYGWWRWAMTITAWCSEVVAIEV